MDVQINDELEVLTGNEDALATLTDAGLTEPISGQVHVVLGTGGQTAVRVEGEDVTVAEVLQGAAQAIDPNARIVTLSASGELQFATGDQEIYLLRNGDQVSGAGLGTAVRPGDSVVTGRRHSNG